MALTICDWKYGKQWVWSITYDEALVDLHRFAIPHHEELGLPGHVEVVCGQIGHIRNVRGSSFGGMRHMGGEELRELMGRGWGVGVHGWSHLYIEPDMLDEELRVSRDALEEATGTEVSLYCAPNSNRNMEDHILARCRELGYLAAMSIRDGVNIPGDECFWLDRSPLVHEYGPPFYNVHDRFRNIRGAQATNGWIIDYCHCPLERPIHINKDCCEAQLRHRLETVLSEGGDDVWCALPEEVVFYHLCRRHAKVEAAAEDNLERRYKVSFEGLPARVGSRHLTFEADVPAAWCNSLRVWVDGTPQPAELVHVGRLRVTVDVADGVELTFRQSSG